MAKRETVYSRLSSISHYSHRTIQSTIWNIFSELTRKIFQKQQTKQRISFFNQRKFLNVILTTQEFNSNAKQKNTQNKENIGLYKQQRLQCLCFFMFVYFYVI